MAGPSKRKAKGPSTTSNGTTVSKKTPPPPFSTPSPILESFLECLNPKHIYISHIDRHPAYHKRNLFVVPVLLNIGIAAGLLVRSYYMFPYYGALILNILGYHSPLSVDTEKTPFPDLMNVVMARTGVLFFDFLIFRFLTPWPIDFFIGDASPTAWRRAVGFQEEEIAVRQSRPSWDTKLPADWMDEGSSNGADIYKQRIMPAITREWIRAKTAYLMMDKSWDLDFGAMLDAHELVSMQKNTLKDFEKTVYVHNQEHGWLVWPVWRLDEGADDERRQKIVLFKDKLTAMGKENLFFRWIEIIQYESNQPGGFTPERRQSAMRQAKELFETQGVDFDKFWEEVGGVQGLPGWDRPDDQSQ